MTVFWFLKTSIVVVSTMYLFLVPEIIFSLAFFFTFVSVLNKSLFPYLT
jgi:hypothetical protein